MAARGQTPSRRPRRAGSESGEASTERYRRERGGIRQGAASTCFRNHDHSRSDVGGEIDRVPQLHRSGIVNFDVITRAENVEFFPRARNTETEAGAAVELLAAGDAIRGQVEFHKFATAVAALAIERHRVAFLVIRSNVEAGGAAGRGTDRGEIERALGQIKTSDAKDVAMNDRVLRIEQLIRKPGSWIESSDPPMPMFCIPGIVCGLASSILSTTLKSVVSKIKTLFRKTYKYFPSGEKRIWPPKPKPG